MVVQKEKEITSQVELCDAAGNLNRDAVGWSRRPLHTCNMKGHWPRKKKWSYWCVTGDDFAFSCTLAPIDYIGLAAGYFFDAKKGELIEQVEVLPLGAGITMPLTVEEDIHFENRKIKISVAYRGEEVHIKFYSPSMKGHKVEADITLKYPRDHETLSVLVPWSDTLFQYTSKHNTLPASGTVVVDGKKFVFNPERNYGCLDFGRGVWPYKVHWNWASSSSRQGDDVIGLQFGDKWTDNTGSTENGICVNGKMFKISDDVRFEYDTKNFMAPWTLRSKSTDEVALKFVPVFDKYAHTNAIVLKTCVHQMFGHFHGVVRVGGREIKVSDAFGWAEEHVGKW